RADSPFPEPQVACAYRRDDVSVVVVAWVLTSPMMAVLVGPTVAGTVDEIDRDWGGRRSQVAAFGAFPLPATPDQAGARVAEVASWFRTAGEAALTQRPLVPRDMRPALAGTGSALALDVRVPAA